MKMQPNSKTTGQSSQPPLKRRTMLRIVALSLATLLVVGGVYVAFAQDRSAKVVRALILRPIHHHQNAATLEITTPNGIREEQFVHVGGIDHWITIRGEDRKNPVLLVLHGGPGSGHTMFNTTTREWETYFTIVQYDQRGASKTFRRNGSKLQTNELSFDQLEQDALAVTSYVRSHLGKHKVFLVASSVGSTFGLHLAQNHSELFHAYVGTDQNVGGDAFGHSFDITLGWLRQYRYRPAPGPPQGEDQRKPVYPKQRQQVSGRQRAP